MDQARPVLGVRYPVPAEYEPAVLGLLPVQVSREAVRKPDIRERGIGLDLKSVKYQHDKSPLSPSLLPCHLFPTIPDVWPAEGSPGPRKDYPPNDKSSPSNQ